MKKYILAAIATGAVLAASSASALTYNIYDLDQPSGSNNLGTPFRADLELLFGVGDVGFGLVQSAEAAVDATADFGFWNSASGFENAYTFGLNTINEPDTDNSEDFTYTNVSGAVEVFTGDDMIFTVENTNGCCNPGAATDATLGMAGFGIFYDLGKVDGTSEFVILAFADRDAGEDIDYSDHMVKTQGDVNVVPLPAAGLMLLAGLGGLGMMRRKQKS